VGSITDQAVAGAMVKLAIKTYGRIDIIINNAGAGDPRSFEDTSEDQLWDQLRLHLGGTFNMSQAASLHDEAKLWSHCYDYLGYLVWYAKQQLLRGRQNGDSRLGKINRTRRKTA
jgi:NAD(P)-dependent dehydrogenase (short-subunit alcohol dehydrogenase family)